MACKKPGFGLAFNFDAPAPEHSHTPPPKSYDEESNIHQDVEVLRKENLLAWLTVFRYTWYFRMPNISPLCFT